MFSKKRRISQFTASPGMELMNVNNKENSNYENVLFEHVGNSRCTPTAYVKRVQEILQTIPLVVYKKNIPQNKIYETKHEEYRMELHFAAEI